MKPSSCLFVDSWPPPSLHSDSLGVFVMAKGKGIIARGPIITRLREHRTYFSHTHYNPRWVFLLGGYTCFMRCGSRWGWCPLLLNLHSLGDCFDQQNVVEVTSIGSKGEVLQALQVLPLFLRTLPWVHHAGKKPRMKDYIERDRCSKFNQLYEFVQVKPREWPSSPAEPWEIINQHCSQSLNYMCHTVFLKSENLNLETHLAPRVLVRVNRLVNAPVMNLVVVI